MSSEIQITKGFLVSLQDLFSFQYNTIQFPWKQLCMFEEQRRSYWGTNKFCLFIFANFWYFIMEKCLPQKWPIYGGLQLWPAWCCLSWLKALNLFLYGIAWKRASTSANVSILKGALARYLTIRPVAQKGYGSIAHEAKPNRLLNRGPRGQKV